jgi:hypothetical protein
MDSIKRSLLIHVIGANAACVLVNLCSPDEPDTKNYEQLCALLKLCYEPKRNIDIQHRMLA